MEINIKRCNTKDLNFLREISYNTYNETFKDSNTESNMKDYLNKAFSMEKIKEEFSNKASHFYFIYADEKLAGYLKLNEGTSQTEINDKDSIEIQRIYILNEFHGKTLGSALMHKSIEISKEMGKKYIWLGVWEHNEKALRFYEKNGFYVTGHHSFFMGDDEQTDLIMRKDLED